MTREALPPRRTFDVRRVVLPGGGEAAKPTGLLREILETVILTALVFFVVRAAVTPFHVEGPSMQPGMVTDDYVLVNTLAYRFGSPQRGDVIVFHPPSDPSKDYVKRIIGLPGDSISITATSVVVNGLPLHEPYISPIPPGETPNRMIVPTVTLRANEYFVLGDNRLNSSDSRVFGSVPKQNIIGKAEFVFFPLNQIHRIETYPNVFAGVSEK